MEANQINSNQASAQPAKIGIILLALATAMVHLVVLNLGGVDALFALNGLGYLGLLALYFLPIPVAQNNRNLVRWVFIGYAAVTILAWVFVGERNLLGYGTKAVEVLLIILLLMDRS
ncbi:MAG TPA: hypothetical protein VIK64_05520 [Anaerolineales bacterium]